MIAPVLHRLNRREQILAGLGVLVVFFLANLFLWNWLFQAIGDSRVEVAKRKEARNEQTVLLRESDLWSKREQWLREHQPVFHGASDASALLDHAATEIVKAHRGADLRQSIVLVPNPHAISDVAKALQRASHTPALLLPRIVTLPLWAAAVPLARSIASRSARELSLYQALNERCQPVVARRVCQVGTT